MGADGGGKSQNFARALLFQGGFKKHKILCCREIQRSIGESVHALLVDQINEMGMGHFYDVQKTSIIGNNGTEFLFAGLRTNIDNIKSIPGITRVWVEEAQNVSHASMKVLIPTIRADGSEIWLSFNPDLEDDPIYHNFVVDPPSDAIVVKINYKDNTWFPATLEKERLELLRRNPAEYDNVWEGNCKQAVDGAIFANELRIAAEEQRITRVPVQAGVPVNTYWDLGQSDNTAIWFIQIVGMEYRVVDYYQNNGEKIPHYIEVLEDRGYRYGEHVMPHDADYEQQAAAMSIKQQMLKAVQNNPKLGSGVRVVPRIANKALGIDAARIIFGQCLFDREKTTDGLQCLRHYAYAKNAETGKTSKEPKHDDWSHGCLTGDSLVKTDMGYIPIVDVVIGSRVWTPRGFAKVLNSGATKMAYTLIEIKTRSGQLLRCTPEHKILTQKGFVTADTLLYSDSVFTGKEWQCILISLISTVTGLGFRETITGKTNGHSLGQVICTALYGNSITGIYQTIMKSITKTATPLITLLITSKWCMAQNTNGNMLLNDIALDCSSRHQSSPVIKQQNGMGVKRARNGMKITAQRHGKTVNGLNAFVRNAVSRLCRLILRVPGGATRIAHLRILEDVRELVYDLTIENHACYQASGLLVSNSDAFLCFAQHFKRPVIRPKQTYVAPVSFWAQ